MIEGKGGKERNRERSGEVARERQKEWLQRERRNVRERASLQGGFPEVTVLNITEECGMLNRCQGKHTGRATAAPNGCQGLLYIHTKTHKHAVIYVHELIYSTVTQKAQCTLRLDILHSAHTYIHALVDTSMLSAPAEDVILCNCSSPHKTMVIRDQV